MTAAIEFKHVEKRYPSGQEALKNVSFTIGQGEMVFLTGHSGAGKSTLLKLITAIERPTHGQVFVQQYDIKRIKHRQIPYLRRRIGTIFQDHRLLSSRTVFDNIALPLVISGYPQVEIGKRVRAALDKVNLLHKEKSYPLALSAGEQQRVGIARAVVNKPAILLADEPTGNLDPSLSAEIMGLFEQFKAVGVSVLIATHDIALIEHMPYRVLQLNQGQLVTQGKGAQT